MGAHIEELDDVPPGVELIREQELVLSTM